MGHYFRQLMAGINIFGKTDIDLLMFGLNGAGKTTILYKLKLGETIVAIPTFGFNFETIEHKKYHLKILDAGWSPKLCPRYVEAGMMQGLTIFVVDSANRDLFDEARAELSRLLQEVKLVNDALLVLANKQDLPGAMTTEEVAEKLGLNALIDDLRWHVEGTSAVTGQGIIEGIEWLIHQQPSP